MTQAALQNPVHLVADLCRKLTAQRDVIELEVFALQAAVLEDHSAPSGDLLLTLYLVLHSASKAATLATRQGLRVTGAKGQPRAVLGTDVYALIRGDAGAVLSAPDPVLLEMARKKFRLRGGWMPDQQESSRPSVLAELDL